ncbi:MAG TPA: TonB-dependent receptor [Burkholderiaceae bacterium]
MAQSAPEPSTTIVITAARTEQSLADALPSTRVIGRAEIEALQPVDLPGLLRALTSIDVAQAGPLGSQTSLFLRGADSRQTLVLVDGVPLMRADFGTASWQNLPIEQIERVEIVRGNLSSLYGAQAIGGVVQIITRRAQAPQASVSLGTQGTAAGAVSAGTRFGSGDSTTRLSASLSTRKTDGYSARDAAVDPGANPDLDAARQNGASAQLEQNWAPGQRTSFNFMASRTRSEYDGFSPGLDDVLTTRTGVAGLISRHELGAEVAMTVELGQTRERFDDPTGFAPNGDNRVRIAGAQFVWQAAPTQQWQLGAEGKRERFSDTTTPERTRNTDALRLGWLGAFGGAAGSEAAPLQLQANLRSDRSSAYGSETTGMLALAYTMMPGWKASAQWSTAFSAPSFLDELYANPATELRAERSRQGELALQWSGAGGALARAALFAQRQHDRLSFDPVTFETVNIANAKNSGIELMAQLPLGPGRLGAEATFQDPQDTDTGQALKRRARQSVAINYSSLLAGWQTFAALRYTGKRLDTDPVTFADATNPARTTLDVAVQRQLTPVWRVAAKLDNVFDAESSEVLGYTAAPRTLLFTLQATLR